MKKIGVLTSGGDAPGMNAAIRGVVRAAISMDMEVVGVYRGYNGLISGDIKPLSARSVSDIIHRGGTILYTARSPEFKTEEGMAKAIANCKKFGIEGLVVIGGDGSYRGARDLSVRGFPCVGVPGTIDNDISSTDYTIGFDTAMNTAMEMVDKLRDTTQSHDRCSVVEVIGRHAGHLALQTGIAVGATAILVPEVPCTIEQICNKIVETKKNGKQHFIIVVAEGAEISAETVTQEITARTGIDARCTVLGHVQRGGNPTVRDRVAASEMAYAAVKLLKNGIGNRVVCYHDEKIVDYDSVEALNMTKEFDTAAYNMASDLAL